MVYADESAYDVLVRLRVCKFRFACCRSDCVLFSRYFHGVFKHPAGNFSSPGAGSLALLNSERGELDDKTSLDNGMNSEFGSLEPPPDRKDADYHGDAFHAGAGRGNSSTLPSRAQNNEQHIPPAQDQGHHAPDKVLGDTFLCHEIFKQKRYFTDAAANFYCAWQSFGGKTFDSNIWPDSWDTKRIKTAESYYLSMPEEFYTWSCLPVVTPDLAPQWADHILKHVDENLQTHFQEYMSGSLRMTLSSTLMSMLAAFPVDHRYG